MAPGTPIPGPTAGPGANAGRNDPAGIREDVSVGKINIGRRGGVVLTLLQTLVERAVTTMVVVAVGETGG